MVICFVPGSGGYRYMRLLKGMNIDERNVSLHTPQPTPWNYRYLTDLTTKEYIKEDNNEIYLTHTMNTAVIKNFFPGHKIIKIFAPYYLCLQRLFILNNDCSLEIKEQIDQAYQIIQWHHNYYKFNYDKDCDQSVDITQENTKFSQIMCRELNDVSLPFQRAYNIFKLYGDNMPIFDILKNE